MRSQYLELFKSMGSELKKEFPEIYESENKGKIVGNGKGGDKTTLIDKFAEDIIVEKLVEFHKEGNKFTLISEELGIRKFEESENIIAEAKDSARRVDEDSVERAEETNKLILEVLQKVVNIIDRFKTQAQQELEDLVFDYGKARDSIQLRGILNKTTDSSENNKSGDNHHFKGRRELNIRMPYNTMQIGRLVEFLKQIPGIKLESEAASEDNFSIYLDMSTPVPLNNILRELPLVESLDAKGDTIKLRLKQSKNGGS